MLIEGVRKVGSSFTIQNVPIKLKELKKVYKNHFNLQYKMFLLNFYTLIAKNTIKFIYNTKCSY